MKFTLYVLEKKQPQAESQDNKDNNNNNTLYIGMKNNISKNFGYSLLQVAASIKTAAKENKITFLYRIVDVHINWINFIISSSAAKSSIRTLTLRTEGWRRNDHLTLKKKNIGIHNKSYEESRDGSLCWFHSGDQPQ